MNRLLPAALAPSPPHLFLPPLAFILVRTNALPLPGLTWRNSVIFHGTPSMRIVVPFLMSFDVARGTTEARRVGRPMARARSGATETTDVGRAVGAGRTAVAGAETVGGGRAERIVATGDLATG